MTISRRFALTAAVTGAPVAAMMGNIQLAQAQTVDEILSRGEINVGVILDLPLFGTINSAGEPEGYDVDVAHLLGKYLGATVNFVPLTAPNRIPFLLTSKVDLIIATFGITPERAKQVLFAIPYSAIDNMAFSSQDRQLRSYADLAGLRIGVARGSTQDMLFTAGAGEIADIMRFDDGPSTYQAILSGQVDVIGDGKVMALQYLSSQPDSGIVPQFTLSRQPNGITLRPDQWSLHQWVNTFMFYVKNNGELSALHQKWFGEPLPADLPVF